MGQKTSAFKRFLVVVLLLAMTNGATFLYARWRGLQNVRAQEEETRAARSAGQELRAELSEASAELDRLSVWLDFVALQQELTAVSGEIAQLNYGNAIRRLESIREGIVEGDYGASLRRHSAELTGILERAEQALQRTDPGAGRHLVEVNELAFALLSDLASPPRADTPSDDEGAGVSLDLEAPPGVEEGGAEAEEPAADDEVGTVVVDAQDPA